MVRDFKFSVKNKIYERCDPVQQNLAEKSVKFLHHSHHCHSYHSKLASSDSGSDFDSSSSDDVASVGELVKDSYAS